jgi:hypothetical protein
MSVPDAAARHDRCLPHARECRPSMPNRDSQAACFSGSEEPRIHKMPDRHVRSGVPPLIPPSVRWLGYESR